MSRAEKLILVALILFSLLAWMPKAKGLDQSTRKVAERVLPEYPSLARRSGIRGSVRIEVVISAAGKVQSTRVIGGHPLLINAAVEAVRKWKYEPASAPTTTIVTVVFDDSALRGR